jgi:glycosyltransferase involved in cell wall biosynthesis
MMEKENSPVVLIITPSLNPSDNISGISSVVRLLIQEMKGYQYRPFIIGKKDTETRGLSWFLRLISAFVRIWRTGDMDMVHFNLGLEPRSLFRDIFLFVPLCLKHIPIILHIHGGRYMNRQPGVWRRLICFFLQKADAVVVLSDKEKSFLQVNYPETDGRKIEVIPNAIVVPEISMEEKDFHSELSLLFLGRIIREKGLEKIAGALKILKEKGVSFSFYLCGAGPDKEWFMQMLPACLHGHIKDTGVVSGAEKQRVLLDSHIFLLPSFSEGLPVALLESMAYFTVPVVSPVGSIPLVVNEGNGKMVSSAEEMAEAICELDADRDLLRSLAGMSHKTMADACSIPQFIARFKAVYTQQTEEI